MAEFDPLYQIATPAELALPYADHLVTAGYLDSDQVRRVEEAQLAELEYIAAALKMLGQRWYVRSHRSVEIPASFERDQPVEIGDYLDGADFTGVLVTFSTTRIGKQLIGGQTLRALCLTFDNAVTYNPTMREIGARNLLHTPAYSVIDMERW